ncbi:MAG TPA: tRNA lysidine(34) synthetase TilS [Allosphingosinicella sp.]|nr:tRNA lysidine(34) synthetase TilS [Allosphingosinicella sp.]
MTSPSPALVDRFRADLAALNGGCGPIGIAVSGGPDSLALLLLAHAAFPGEVSAATVDHGLRSESRNEALEVARVCIELSCPHSILEVTVPRGGEGIQGEARRARYRALGEWMREAGLERLLTAHHVDDQAETLLMRLQRGSGVSGLAGVRARRPFPEGGENSLILRPLLGWRRAELAAIVREAGLQPADDPSNRDEANDRVRMRRQIAESEWIDVAALAHTARVLADAEEALAGVTSLFAEQRVEAAGDSLLLRPGGLDDEMLRRLALHCIRRVAPDAAPRGEQVTGLLQALRKGRTTTLAGVKCSGGPRFRFEPAPPRRS